MEKQRAKKLLILGRSTHASSIIIHAFKNANMHLLLGPDGTYTDRKTQISLSWLINSDAFSSAFAKESIGRVASTYCEKWHFAQRVHTWKQSKQVAHA
jgi:hypothetical protein